MAGFLNIESINEKHELILEIAYHPEVNVYHDGDKGRVLHAHDYTNKDNANNWHKPARGLTITEFEKYKKFFVGLSETELQHQRSKIR